MDIEAFVFRIGSTTSLNKIEELIDKKMFNNEVARIREFKKMYIREIGDEIISKEVILDEAS